MMNLELSARVKILVRTVNFSTGDDILSFTCKA